LDLIYRQMCKTSGSGVLALTVVIVLSLLTVAILVTSLALYFTTVNHSLSGNERILSSESETGFHLDLLAKYFQNIRNWNGVAHSEDRKACSPKDKYRSIDGRCNNILHPGWGQSFETPKRLRKNSYDDRVNFPRTVSSVDGSPLTSVRRISHVMCPDEPSLAHRISVVHMAYGQYIDHDVTGFPVIKFNDTAIKCCNPDVDPELSYERGGPCFPIEIPHNDTFYPTECMEFIRSSPKLDTKGVMKEPRNQMNSITAFIDASTVYGSDDTFLAQFKNNHDGTLKVEANNMLPRSNKSNCVLDNNQTDYCLAAGDARVNVFLGLGMFHTVFHREHNRLVEQLRAQNQRNGIAWSSEKLFQEARKINAALHQHLTYAEYLPTFLSEQTMVRYRLKTPTVDSSGRNSYVYNNRINPQMSNEFSTAAFRYGHSQIQRTVKIGNHSRVKMESTLMRPHLLLKHGVEDIMTGMGTAFSENVDRLFVSAITDKLFEKNPSKRDGLDLVSLNTQRGRDHGLQPYNEYREMCGLQKITSFNHPDLNQKHMLRKVYKHVDDIDLFIGGISEEPLRGSMVGPLFACILGRQFRDLKYGDRFWYETSDTNIGFTPAQLRQIQKMTISAVICENSNLFELQKHAFLYANLRDNPTIPCRQQPKMDLSPWAFV